MTKYAPANADGEKPYIVWKGWSGNDQLSYGVNLRGALTSAYGDKGAKAGNGRRATPEEVTARDDSSNG